MFRRSTLLAIAASAALGLAMLAPTSASAMRGGGGGHGGGMHGGGHGGGMHVAHGGGMRGGHGGGIRRGHGGERHVGHRHHRHRHVHVRFQRPIWYGVGTAGYTVARPVAAGPCTCLSKEYTPEGAVLFKDLCTKEAAMNPPVIAPRQSSSIDPPIQQAASSPQYQETPDNALAQVDPTTGLPK